jgi:hypothetical protein
MEAAPYLGKVVEWRREGESFGVVTIPSIMCMIKSPCESGSDVDG